MFPVGRRRVPLLLLNKMRGRMRLAHTKDVSRRPGPTGASENMNLN